MTTDDGTGTGDVALPHSIEVLWSLRSRQQRTVRTGLTVERIVTAAIECVDADGLAALSMARVAKRLDFATMSLYRHVTSKDELQQLMLDMAYGTPPRIDTTDWRTGLERWARAFQEVFRRHPWMLQISVSGPPLEPGQLSWLECGLGTLSATSLRPDEKLAVMMLMIGYVRNNVQLSVGVSDQGISDADLMAHYGRALAKYADPETFPAIAELVEAGAFEEPDDDFTFGLQRVLDGVEVLVRIRDGEKPLT
ncbi:TetR/AcrR family transcriptional regulator [Streptomyces sp. NPDC012389]|uniref:TetR/AcrR family transcriptional regulator n=1 Tax=unclassified Streptomyces TaxID=2593676 RepID=UPI00081EC0AA|nr:MULTISPECIES: TetR/AcrR family transcriptional regulator [unclassified Streptomyces]SCD82082.1 transcriptional regulator, TetR family [Streptomyces sp. ScaeMP-e83]